MMTIDPAQLARFNMLALKTLGERALTWVAMLMTCAGFGYTIYDPTPLRLAAISLFTLGVFWRVTWVEKISQPKGGENAGNS